MNSFVSLLSATHTRIEAIENVVWPPTNTQIESTMQPVRLTFSPKIIKYFRYYLQKSKDPDLWRALFSNKAQAKIWVTRRKICNFIDGRIRDFYKLIREALELKQNL